MRYIWAWGSWTAWLVVPCGGLMWKNSDFNGLLVAGLFVGLSGVFAANWGLSTLIFRMLEVGDRAERLEAQREIEAEAKKAQLKTAAVVPG